MGFDSLLCATSTRLTLNWLLGLGYDNILYYLPSVAGGTRSPLVTPHRLQHFTSCLSMNDTVWKEVYCNYWAFKQYAQLAWAEMGQAQLTLELQCWYTSILSFVFMQNISVLCRTKIVLRRQYQSTKSHIPMFLCRTRTVLCRTKIVLRRTIFIPCKTIFVLRRTNMFCIKTKLVPKKMTL